MSVCVLCVIRELLLKEKRKATRIKEGGGMMGNMNLILTGVRTGGGDQALNNNKKKISSSSLLFFLPFLHLQYQNSTTSSKPVRVDYQRESHRHFRERHKTNIEIEIKAIQEGKKQY